MVFVQNPHHPKDMRRAGQRRPRRFRADLELSFACAAGPEGPRGDTRIPSQPDPRGLASVARWPHAVTSRTMPKELGEPPGSPPHFWWCRQTGCRHASAAGSPPRLVVSPNRYGTSGCWPFGLAQSPYRSPQMSRWFCPSPRCADVQVVLPLGSSARTTDSVSRKTCQAGSGIW